MKEKNMTFKLVKGIVKNLKVKNEYKDYLNDNLQQKAGVVAFLTTSIGTGATASAMTTLVNRSRPKLIDNFRCNIDDLKISGYLENISFRNGDIIEFVVDEKPITHKSFTGHAARCTKQKFMWLQPYHTKGITAYKRLEFKFIFWFSFITLSVCTTILLWANWPKPIESLSSFSIFISIPILIAITITIIYKAGGGTGLFYARQTTKIFEVLNYKNPELVDADINSMEAYWAYTERYGKNVDFLKRKEILYQDSDLEK